jgi:hypothetical protein
VRAQGKFHAPDVGQSAGHGFTRLTGLAAPPSTSPGPR